MIPADSPHWTLPIMEASGTVVCSHGSWHPFVATSGDVYRMCGFCGGVKEVNWERDII